MPIKWSPNGQLDIATDPTELPEESQEKMTVSGAMTRCTNLNLDRSGIAQTRNGSLGIGNISMCDPFYKIHELEGVRYIFAADKIFKNEVTLAEDLTSSPWDAISYNAYNIVDKSVFAVNKSHRKRIDPGGVFEWGIEPPSVTGLSLKKSLTLGYLYDWEVNYVNSNDIQDYTETNKWAYTYEWEEDYLDYSILEDDGVFNTWAYTYEWEVDYIDDTGYYAWIVANNMFLWWSSSLVLWQWETGTRKRHETQIASPAYYAWIVAQNKFLWWSSSLILWTFETGVMKESVTTINYPKRLFWEADSYQVNHKWEYGMVLGEDSLFPDDDEFVTIWWFELVNDISINYSVKITFCRKNGDILECESNPSDAKTTLIDSGLVVVPPQTSNDPQVTHIRIYRTLQDIAAYYLEEEVALGTTFVVLTKRDTELSVPLETDHDRPPTGGTILAGPNFNGVCFMAVKNFIYFCKAQQPEYWPATNLIEIGSPQFPVTAMSIFSGQLYAATAREIYSIQGAGASSFFPLAMTAQTGTLSKSCFLPVKGQGIFHLGYDGIYLFTITDDKKISRNTLEPIFAGVKVGDIPPIDKTYIANSWMQYYKNKLYFGYPTDQSPYPSHVIVFDLHNSRTLHYQYNMQIVTTAYDSKYDRLLGIDSCGHVYELEKQGAAKDGQDSIAWAVETKEFNNMRKYFPRYARYDVDLGENAQGAGYVLLDNDIKQIHNFREDRQTRKRHITGCTGDRLSVRLSGEGAVTIYGLEVE